MRPAPRRAAARSMNSVQPAAGRMARTGAGRDRRVTRTLTCDDGVLAPPADTPPSLQGTADRPLPPPPGKGWLHSGSLRQTAFVGAKRSPNSNCGVYHKSSLHAVADHRRTVNSPEGDKRSRLAASMVNRCVRHDDRRRFPEVRPRRDTWLLRRPLESGTARKPRRHFRRDKPSSCPAGRAHARSTRYATCPATRPGSLPCSCPSTSQRSVHPTTPTSTQPDRTSYQWYFGLEKQPIGRQLRCATISIRSVTGRLDNSRQHCEQDLTPLTLAGKRRQSRHSA